MRLPAPCVPVTLVIGVALSAFGSTLAQSQSNPPAIGQAPANEKLEFAVILTRHGVRSPTRKTDELNRYSRQPWPTWSVAPGHLTEHGAHLMTLVGAYDREQFASEGLLTTTGCADADHIKIIADSDQRTRETGRSLAVGLAPSCSIEVSSLPEGTVDPLFHSLRANAEHADNGLAFASVVGRIGSSPEGLIEAYRPQLESLQEVLRGCSPGAECAKPGAVALPSIFDVPSSLGIGKGSRLLEFHSPMSLASTMAEDFLLEYTEGMEMQNVGWGRLDLHKLREMVQIHTAEEDITGRSSYIACVQSSSLLFHILASLEQAAQQKAVAGALTKPSDRLLILVGHDTNLANVSGALNLSWLVDGRRDDTPPGGALVVELWKQRGTAELTVRAYFMAQSLDQMRNASPLSLAEPPERAALWIPGCSRADLSCDWGAFQKAIESAMIPAFAK